MSAVVLTPDDLAPFAVIDEAKAEIMIADALAMAARVAPCILSVDFEYDAAAKAIIRGAVLRWNDAGSGALNSEQVGPFGAGIDTRQQRRGMFWPSEIAELQELCRSGEPAGAFTIDTAATAGCHSPVCALYFGALYCSCGADLTNFVYPLYEL